MGLLLRLKGRLIRLKNRAIISRAKRKLQIKRGSANNPIDIPISDEFKFEDSVESFGAIRKKITQCMSNYENETQKFEAYRERTRKEETAFKLDVQAVFGGK